GAVKVEQHTQQIKGGITFAVQQDLEHLLLQSLQGGFAPPTNRSDPTFGDGILYQLVAGFAFWVNLSGSL
ncbi:hypothetical protein, partial [Phormidesmis priestleyi]